MIFNDNKTLSSLLKQYYKEEEGSEKQKEIKSQLSDLSSYIAIDTETTGTNPRVHQLIELGYVLLDKDYKITKTLDFKLKRDKNNFPEWNDFAEKIHGIPEKSIKEANGKDIIDLSNISSDMVNTFCGLSKKEAEISDFFQLLKITRPEFQAWNVTFDYSFYDKMLEVNGLGLMDQYFSYSPFDMKTYVKPSVEIGRIELNVLKDEFPEIFKEGTRMLDGDGNVKVNMNSLNMYFGCNGQYDSNQKPINHSAIEDIFKSVTNIIGTSMIEANNSRNQTLQDIKLHEFYSDTFIGEKMKLDITKQKDNTKINILDLSN